MVSYSVALGETGAIAPVTLRDYQQAAVEAVRLMFRDVKRVLYVLPTGGGKTVTFSYIVRQCRQKGRRVVVVAHRIEIVRQISRALHRQGVPHGIVAPGYAPTDDAVQVAMVQTLVNRLGSKLPNGLDGIPEPDLLVIDEAHHTVAGSWQKVTAAWRNALQLGVTATPERLDGRGLGTAFDEIVLGPSARELIDAGSLADFTYLAPPNETLDLSGVHTRGGDFAADELAQAMERSTIVGDAVQHYAEHMGGKPAIAFCISVAHAEHVAERFRAAGWRAASIDGGMGKLERDGILADLEHGRLDVLTSCDLVSEGFDVPAVTGALLLRPTKSLALFLQQVGRALRPKPDGSKAIILDHVGNCHRHGLPDWDREWTLHGKIKRDKAPAVTVCELCFKTFPAEVPRAADFACGGVGEFPCPFMAEKKTKPRPPLEEVDGKLVDVKAAMPANPLRPDWADRIDPATARGKDWFRLLDLAGTDPDRLKEIEKARGYKRGWHRHQIAKRYELDAAVDAVWNRTMAIGDAPEAVLWAVIRYCREHHPVGSAAYVQTLLAEINNRKTRAA